MKISVPQLLASAVGAVLAALIASLFGVKGTIIGVGIGSVVATTGTALAARWIERTHRAIRQVVVGPPGHERVVRVVGRPGRPGNVTRVTAARDEGASGDRAQPGAPPGVPARARPGAAPSARPRVAARRRVRWGTYALAVGAVLVSALLLVTAVELIAGRPLSALIGAGGSPGSGPSVSDIFDQPSTAVTEPTTTTTTAGTPTTPTTTTTSTTVAGAATPTTTTTTAGVPGAVTPTTTTTTTTTSTTVPSAAPGGPGTAGAVAVKPPGG